MDVRRTPGGNRVSVAMVIPGLGAGGAEKTIAEMANVWVEEGHRVTVVTLEPPGRAPFHSIDPRVSIRQLDVEPALAPFGEAFVMSLRRILRIRRTLSRLSPDVVISFLTRTNIWTLLATRGLGLPVIISERNNPRRQRVNLVWKLLRRVLYRRAAAVTALTSEVLACYPPEIRKNGDVIPCAFTVPAQPAARSGLPLLTAVGRLVDQKGFDLLLRAFAQVAPAHPAWNLVIWGEGPERGRLEALRDALGLEARVRLPGLTSKPREWVAGSHLFVLSSRYEGLGNVIGEAMAAGLPVVAFDCEWGPREFIRDGISGRLVPPGDIDALGKALDEVMADAPLRDRFAKEARSSMARFSPERIMAQWNRLIERATRGSTLARSKNAVAGPGERCGA